MGAFSVGAFFAVIYFICSSVFQKKAVDEQVQSGRPQPVRPPVNVASGVAQEVRSGQPVRLPVDVASGVAQEVHSSQPVRLPVNVAGGVAQVERSRGCFSLDEIKMATHNFDDARVVGNGGFGKVYKGLINNGDTVVAAKRLNPESHQCDREFWTEVQTLSDLRHTHLVELIGYCNEHQEMILVYEYMSRGTLADHLYKRITTETNTSTSLTWEQRLNICIGAARGLNHLHEGTNKIYVHRDVKTTNILVDENWVAKIGDFGLSKGPANRSITHISCTDVRGTLGYLDPNYHLTRRLTIKSDVYAFGVVLLEVLCGRRVVDDSLAAEQISLVLWARPRIRERKLDGIIDPSLRGQIPRHCLKSFAALVDNCLHESPQSRPTMAEVLDQLEFALPQQRGRRERGGSSASGPSNVSLSSSEDGATVESMPTQCCFFCLKPQQPRTT